MKSYDVLPRVAGKVRLGSNKGEVEILVGRLSEKGNREDIVFDGSDNFVVLEVGKRGSGKSYGMGALLEGFATQSGSKIGKHGGAERKAVVLLDPLDTHWTALIPLRDEGPAGLRKQWKVHDAWGDLEVEPIDVQVFVPAGYRKDHDMDGVQEYQLPVESLDSGDWALLLQTNVVTEPRGRLVDEALHKVRDLGWDREGEQVPAKREYGIEDLIECIERDSEIQDFYNPETCRSVLQPLRTLARMELFASPRGTPLVEVAKEGVLSVLSLGRLSQDLRVVLTTVFVRHLKSDRKDASEIRKRLALNPENPEVRMALEESLRSHAPKTILAVDEAQILMPKKGGSTARKELDAFVLEGRNFGLSLWLATQRPKGAISDAAASQIDTFIVHRLSVHEDIQAVCGLFQNSVPEEVKFPGGVKGNIFDVIRKLDIGQAVFSSAGGSANRVVIGKIRPRNVAHGGESF